MAISGNEWPSVAIIGNHRLPNSTMLLSPLTKPRGPTICERPALGDLPWPGEPISTLPPRHISKVGTLRHEKMRRAIRGHRRSSEVIRGHQRSSVVIRGHRRSSVVIRGHQRSSEVIRGHTPAQEERSTKGSDRCGLHSSSVTTTARRGHRHCQLSDDETRPTAADNGRNGSR